MALNSPKFTFLGVFKSTLIAVGLVIVSVIALEPPVLGGLSTLHDLADNAGLWRSGSGDNNCPCGDGNTACDDEPRRDVE